MTDSDNTPAPGTSKIEPPDGWAVHSAYGVQKTADGTCLVRLAEVCRWLMQTRDLPISAAVEQVCAPLEGGCPPTLYVLDATGFASPKTEPRFFAPPPPHGFVGPDLPPVFDWARLVAGTVRGTWLMPAWQLAELANEPGLPQEYSPDRETPFEFSERAGKTNLPATAAVDFASAHALWGWGASPASVTAPAVAGLDIDGACGMLIDVARERLRLHPELVRRLEYELAAFPTVGIMGRLVEAAEAIEFPGPGSGGLVGGVDPRRLLLGIVDDWAAPHLPAISPLVAGTRAAPGGASMAQSDPDEWTGQRLAARHVELKRQGVKNPTKQLAQEAGIGGKDPTGTVRHRIKKFKKSQQTNPLAGLGNVRTIKRA